jgi:hypothetical protein
MRNRFESHPLALTLVCAALGGCVIAPPRVSQPYYTEQSMTAPTEAWPADQTELMPPLPTFLTLQDCELAYGSGACGIGSAVYGQASLAPPPDAYNWYMPFAFGTMTGALLHDHYAPPSIYRAQVPYRSYLQPMVIQRYALVTPQTVRIYRSAPPLIQQQIFTTGPGPYLFQRGAHPPPGFDRAPNQRPEFGPAPWHGQNRSEPILRPWAPNQAPGGSAGLPPPGVPPAGPNVKPPPPAPNPAPALAIPLKPSPMPHIGVEHGPPQLPPRSVAPMPSIGNTPPYPGQNQGPRFDRPERTDRPDRPGAGNSGNRPSDRNSDEKK